MNPTSFLRDATLDAHKAAERTALSKAMIDGTITAEQWRDYLTNLIMIVSMLEAKSPLVRPWDRSIRIKQDLLFHKQGIGRIVSPTLDYIEHLIGLDETAVLGHVYVRYLADLCGGQMMKVPFPTGHLRFDDRQATVTAIKGTVEPVQERIIGEANASFVYWTKIYEAIV